MDDNIRVIGLDFVNAYLLKARDGFVLIDTGLSYQWATLEKELLAAGCEPGKLKIIIITHGDMDHTGNARRLREKFGARIAVHPGDIPQVENGALLKRTVRPLLYKFVFTFRMLMRKLRKNKSAAASFKPDILLSDGQSLEEYGIKAKVVHIPGHTPGSIGVLTEEGGFFAGDTFVNRKKPESARIVENLAQLESSLEKIKKLNVKTVYPGHGKPFPMEDYLKTR